MIKIPRWFTFIQNKFGFNQSLKVGSRVRVSTGEIGVVTNGVINVHIEDIKKDPSRSINLSKFVNTKGEIKPYVVEVLLPKENT